VGLALEITILLMLLFFKFIVFPFVVLLHFGRPYHSSQSAYTFFDKDGAVFWGEILWDLLWHSVRYCACGHNFFQAESLKRIGADFSQLYPKVSARILCVSLTESTNQTYRTGITHESVSDTYPIRGAMVFDRIWATFISIQSISLCSFC
jgi:hypothetical protein